MTFFFSRPSRLHLSDDCTKTAKAMRRRPLHKCGSVKFFKKEKNTIDNDDEIDIDVAAVEDDGGGANDNEEEEEVSNGKSSNNNNDNNDNDKKDDENSKSNGSEEMKDSQNDSKETIDTLDGNSKLPPTIEVKVNNNQKLDKILKKLTDRMASRLALNGNGTNGTHQNNNHNSNKSSNSNGHYHAPTSYSLASHIANTINAQPHQHVSPRKRILRELEKVSLEDTKRSRPKSIPTSITTNGFASTIAAVMSNGSVKSEKSTPPTSSRPISSYSITSLLAHKTSSNASTGCNNNNSINSNDLSSASQYNHHQQQQRLPLNSPSPKSQSPSLMHNKRKSPHTTTPPSFNNNNSSPPTHSPSPEPHAFHKYRPNAMATTPTSSSTIPASSPFNSTYHSPNYMRGSPSPHDRLRTTTTSSAAATTGNYHLQQHSPSRYGTTSPHQTQNYSAAASALTPTMRDSDSSLSPNVERAAASNNNNSTRNTPTNMSVGIRTVPKKTAALRQQFSSPTMESSNKLSKASSSNVTSTVTTVKSEKPMDVDSLLRPSVLIPPPPIPTSMAGHPASLSHYPYMYSPLSYLTPHAVSPYYHSFYNPAMMAAAAAAYRFPIPGYPGSQMNPLTSPPHHHHPPTTASSPSAYDRNGNGQHHLHQRSSSISSSSSSPPATVSTTSAHHHHQQHQQHLPYVVPTSPWNPIPLTNHHSISDGNNLITKVKDEQSSG